MAPLIYYFTQGIKPAAMILSAASQVKRTEISRSAVVSRGALSHCSTDNKATTIACPSEICLIFAMANIGAKFTISRNFMPPKTNMKTETVFDDKSTITPHGKNED